MNNSNGHMMMLGLVFLADMASPGSCSCNERHEPYGDNDPDAGRARLSVSIPDCSCFPDPTTVYVDGEGEQYQSQFNCKSKSSVSISVQNGSYTVKARNVSGAFISTYIEVTNAREGQANLICPKSNTDTTRCSNTGCSNSYSDNNPCANSSCVSCPAATDNILYVDPLNGNDATGTGHNSTNCRLKTVRRALDAVGVKPGFETRILILAQGTVGSSNGDSFPITVPTHVTISGAEASGSGSAYAKVVVSPNADGFIMNAPDSVLENLDIAGQKSSGAGGTSSGVNVRGRSDTTTAIRHVSIHDFPSDGIRVSEGGVLTIGQGVTSNQNGSSGSTARYGSGLCVGSAGANMSAKVIIDVSSGSQPVRFDNNAVNGIRVEGLGSVAIAAPVESAEAAIVSTSDNGGSGVWIEQAYNDSTPLPVNEINGLVSRRNKEDGIRVYGGSALKLRRSVILANTGNGVMVKSNSNGPYDASQIDLGRAGDVPSWGGNTLQSAVTGDRNGAAGICLMFYVHADPVTLNAAGNIFSALEQSTGPIDCATTSTGPVLTTSNDCTGAVDISVYALAGSSHIIDVSNCRDSLGE